MELHKGRHPTKDFALDWNNVSLDDVFNKALEFTEAYYADNLSRYRSLKPSDVDSHLFWSEYIWCVYTSGFNASIVNKKIGALLRAYGPWYSRRNPDDIWILVKQIIANRLKFESIIHCRGLLVRMPFVKFRAIYCNSPEDLRKLPFIGNITKNHLARNIGFDVVKEDVHLTRLARHFRRASALELCSELSALYNERVGVVDFILWSYCAAHSTQEIS